MHSLSPSEKYSISTIARVNVSFFLIVFFKPVLSLIRAIFLFVLVLIQSPGLMRLQICHISSSLVGSNVTQPSFHLVILLPIIFIAVCIQQQQLAIAQQFQTHITLSYNNKMHKAEHLRELQMPTKYDSTKNEFDEEGHYIAGLTHADVSQLITSFPFIYQIYKKNTPNNQWKLLDYLMKVPSQTDGPGFIYGFMNQSENSLLEAPYWIKMGRTVQYPPQNRIFQWQKDENVNLTQIFTVRSLYNKKLQNLVHTLFAYARTKRVLNGKNRLEWFKFDEITLTASAVNVLNHLMNTIHTSENSKQKKLYLNRPLKQLTDKLIQSNNQITDICNTSTHLIAQSLARDLGIQIGRNDQIKLKLSKCQSIIQMIELIKQLTIGKQLKECCNQIRMAQQMVDRFTIVLKQFEMQAFHNIGQTYENTAIKIVRYSEPSNTPLNNNGERNDNGYHFSINNKNNCEQNIKIEHIQIKQTDKTEKKSKKFEVQANNAKQSNLQITKKRKPRKKSKQIGQNNLKQINNSKKQDNDKQYENKFVQKIEILKQQHTFNNQHGQDLTDVCKEIQRLQLTQNHMEVVCKNREQKILQKIKQQVETVTITYDQHGNEKHRSIQKISSKKIKEKNKNFTKYKRDKDCKLQYPANNNLIPRSQQQQDLDITKTQEQINDQIGSMQNRMCQILQIQRISELIKNLGSYRNTKDFFIYSNKLIMDIPQLKLDYNFIIMTKSIELKQSISIQKGKSKHKGFLNIFCENMIDNQKLFTIDKNCSKYVGVFKVVDARQIIPLDEYHIKKQTLSQEVKGFVTKYLQIFPN